MEEGYKGDVENSTVHDFKEWMKALIFPGEFEEFVHVTKEYQTPHDKVLDCSIYTDMYKYKFIVIERSDRSYMGCQVSARKPRAGEDWSRGNDLVDGPLNSETWNKILRDILNYEIVRLSPYRKPDVRPDRR